jgi:hypothetical protein
MQEDVEGQLKWNMLEGICFEVEDDKYISKGNKLNSGDYTIRAKWRFLNNVRRETGMHFRYKRKEYLKDEIN